MNNFAINDEFSNATAYSEEYKVDNSHQNEIQQNNIREPQNININKNNKTDTTVENVKEPRNFTVPKYYLGEWNFMIDKYFSLLNS